MPSAFISHFTRSNESCHVHRVKYVAWTTMADANSRGKGEGGSKVIFRGHAQACALTQRKYIQMYREILAHTHKSTHTHIHTHTCQHLKGQGLQPTWFFPTAITPSSRRPFECIHMYCGACVCKLCVRDYVWKGMLRGDQPSMKSRTILESIMWRVFYSWDQLQLASNAVSLRVTPRN